MDLCIMPYIYWAPLQLITICAAVKSKCAVGKGNVHTKDNLSAEIQVKIMIYMYYADCQVLCSCKSC